MKKRAHKSRRAPASTALVNSLVDLFVRKYRWRAKRNNVHRGPLKNGGWVNCGEPGEADITAYVPHLTEPRSFHILNVEAKFGSGRQSHEQKIWQQGVEGCGEYYLLARSQQDVMDFVIAKGWAK